MEIGKIDCVLEFELDGTDKIRLTMAGAKELYAQLHDLVGKKETVYVGGCRCYHQPIPYVTWASASNLCVNG